MEGKDTNAMALARPIAPLLRAIAIEIRARAKAVRELRDALTAIQGEGRKNNWEWEALDARLFVELRELGHARRELRDLHWELVEAFPMRFVYRGKGPARGMCFDLTETGVELVSMERRH